MGAYFCMDAYKCDVVVVIKMGAYNYGVLILCGCLLSQFYGMCACTYVCVCECVGMCACVGICVNFNTYIDCVHLSPNRPLFGSMLPLM